MKHFSTIGNIKFNSINKKYAVIALAITLPLVIILYTAGYLGSNSVTAQKFIDLQQGNTSYSGFRRAHAKGICISGVFEANATLTKYSTAEIFNQDTTEFIGRFSIAGNNPHANDLDAPVRSLALQFFLNNGQQWRTAMNTPPVTAVATPEAFYEQLVALSPDPVTKQRDPQKIKDFFNAHPESKTFTDWSAHYQASKSFTTERYHSINAFYLVDRRGVKHAVRWMAVPQVEEQAEEHIDAQADKKDTESRATMDAETNVNRLQQDLVQRLKQQPIRFSLVFTFANADDDENNPTLLWPATRQTITAGTILITASEAQKGGACDAVNFDPLVLPAGIEATEDPILNARPAAYAESYRRRAREVLVDQINPKGR